MKRAIPWGSLVGFLLLLALGIGIPFWLEYRSLSNPPKPTAADAKTDARPALKSRKGAYCGNCGGYLSLPEWGGIQDRASGDAAPLSLNSWERAPWAIPQSSTPAPTPSSRFERPESP